MTAYLAEITPANVNAACHIEVRPEQRKFVAPVAWSLAEADAQGRGYGAFAVSQVAQEARRRGFSRITVLWGLGKGGPEGFYLRQGFRPTGEVMSDQAVGELTL
jgi:diamine N-acetyltransferase